MSALTINVTRDSVAAGDDIDAPHTYAFEMDAAVTLGEVFDHLATRRYLASVGGRGHSWVARIRGEVVAEFKANRHQPASTNLLKKPLSQWSVEGQLEMHFIYLSAAY